MVTISKRKLTYPFFKLILPPQNISFRRIQEGSNPQKVIAAEHAQSTIANFRFHLFKA